MIGGQLDGPLIIRQRLGKVLAEFAQSAMPDEPLGLIEGTGAIFEPQIDAPFGQRQVKHAQASLDEAFQDQGSFWPIGALRAILRQLGRIAEIPRF